MANLILNGSTSGSVTLSSPAVSGTTTLTLPTTSGTVVTDSATQTLTNKTLTSPILTTPALGTPSALVLTNATGLPASSLPAGTVLQVVSTTKADTQTITGSSYVQISGLTATITPANSANKILISVSVGFGGGTNFYPAFTLYRNSTAINLNSGSGTGEECSFGFQNPTSAERYFQVNHQFLDSPSLTSAITYSVYVSPMRTASQTININTANSVADNNQLKGTSTITVMEIKG
jgi:hypothetical protein